MSKLEFVLTLLAVSTMPLGILYLYDKFYNYIEEENDEVPLDEEEKGAD